MLRDQMSRKNRRDETRSPESPERFKSGSESANSHSDKLFLDRDPVSREHLCETTQVAPKSAALQAQTIIKEIERRNYLARNNNTIFGAVSRAPTAKSCAGHTSEPVSSDSRRATQSSSESNITGMDGDDTSSDSRKASQSSSESNITGMDDKQPPLSPQRSSQSSLIDAKADESNKINPTIVGLLAAAAAAAVILAIGAFFFPPSSFMLLLALGNIGKAIATMIVLAVHVAEFSCLAGYAAAHATTFSQNESTDDNAITEPSNILSVR